MKLRLSLLSLVSLLLTFTSQADTVRSLGNINKVKGGKSAISYVQSGNKFFFSRTTDEYGSELWVTDGTAAGTTLVKDIEPGPDSSQPSFFAAATFSGTPGAYFFARTAANGQELWKTDGTAVGTQLVEDLNPGAADGVGGGDIYTSRILTAPDNDFAVFSGNNGVDGFEPWYSSNGTAAGTNMMDDINNAGSSNPYGFTLIANVFYAFSAQDSTNDRELYTGILGLAPNLHNLNLLGSSNPFGLFPLGIQLLYSANNGITGNEPHSLNAGALANLTNPGDSTIFNFSAFDSDTAFFTKFNLLTTQGELYQTDGSVLGTSLITALDCVPGGPLFSFPLNSSHVSAPVINNKMVFNCYDFNKGEVEPWVSDGTAGGTVLLKDIAPGELSSDSFLFVRGANNLLFQANDTVHGFEFWITDGSSSNTKLMLDLNPGEASSVNSENTLLSLLLGNLNNPSSGIIFPATVKRSAKVFYSDGSAENTREIFDDSGDGDSSSSPGDFIRLGDNVLFSARSTTKGEELFRTQGSRKTTKLLKNINRGGDSYPGNFVKNGRDKIIFTAENYKRGEELWITDGTARGTKLLKDIVPGIRGSEPTIFKARRGKRNFLTSSDETHGEELWITKGTRRSTRLIRDIAAGANGSDVSDVVRLGRKLIFSANDQINGNELWISNGTEASTAMLLNISAGASGSYPDDLAVLGDKVFFSANDGIHGKEIWMTDGTSAGTQLLKDIEVGASGSGPDKLVVSGSYLYFVAETAANGQELYRTDGTSAGTILIKDIYPGVDDSDISDITPFSESRIIFAADNGVNGFELWISGGDAGSAQLLKDIKAGASSSVPDYLYKVPRRNLVYFRASTVESGNELWRTNGTTEGTVQVADLNPGAENSYPHSLFASGRKIYFGATKDEAGSEPFYARIPRS